MRNDLLPEKETAATNTMDLCLIHPHGVMAQKEKPFLSTSISCHSWQTADSYFLQRHMAQSSSLHTPPDGIISNWPQHSHLHSKQHHPNYYRSPAVHFRAPIFMDESLISAGSLALVALETHRNKMWSIRRLQNCQCFNQ